MISTKVFTLGLDILNLVTGFKETEFNKLDLKLVIKTCESNGSGWWNLVLRFMTQFF